MVIISCINDSNFELVLKSYALFKFEKVCVQHDLGAKIRLRFCLPVSLKIPFVMPGVRILLEQFYMLNLLFFLQKLHHGRA
jgi:hypothetical protein